MIKIVFFDIGGVITYNVSGYVRNDIVKALGITKKQYEQACHVLVPLLSVNKITEKEFWKRFVGITKTEKQVPDGLWVREFSKRQKLRKEVVKIIKELKRNGLAVASISNVIPPHVKGRSKDIKKYLDFQILSCEVGARKPDEKIYQMALKKAKVRPQEAVFIDNKLLNVEAARNLGIKSIFYRSPKQLRNRLESLGLLKTTD